MKKNQNDKWQPLANFLSEMCTKYGCEDDTKSSFLNLNKSKIGKAMDNIVRAMRRK